MMKEFLAKLQHVFSKIRMTERLGILLAVIFAADFLFLLWPQFLHYRKLGKNIEEIHNNIDRTIGNIERVRSLRLEAQGLKENIQLLQQRMVSPDNPSAALERIAEVADKNYVDIVGMTPDPANRQVLLERNDKKYFIFPVTVDAKATYHDFGRFVNQLENDTLFVRPDEFSITGAQGRHDVRMTLKVVLFEGPRITGEAASGQPQAAAGGYLYHDDNRRDPFTPLLDKDGKLILYDNELVLEDLKLEGIMFSPDPQQRLAIINGNIVKVHDIIGPFKVGEILKNGIVLQKGREMFRLNLKKEE